MEDLSGTREIWEDVIGEFAKMWLNEEYPGYEGKYWSLPPRKILPKPWGGMHPAMWYAAGNTSSYEMAARKGLGVLGFSIGDIGALEPVLDAYKAAIGEAEPVGGYVNDNVMVTTHGVRRRGLRHGLPVGARLVDDLPAEQRLPLPRHLPAPARGAEVARAAAGQHARDRSRYQIDGGLICGDPDEALAQCQRWESAGADQLVFGVGMATHEQYLETIRLIGEHVIPKIDTDPEHSHHPLPPRATAH